MTGWLGWVAWVGCGEVSAPEALPSAEALERRPGDLEGTLECQLAGGDVEAERTCDGLHVESCTDLRDATFVYRGGWSRRVALSGTAADLDVVAEPAAVRIRTVTGREWLRPSAPTGCADADGDGFRAYEDCDDADADVHPGAPEWCNGVDDDCDPSTSEDGTASRWVGGAWTDATPALTTGFVADVAAGETLHLCAGTWIGTVNLDGDGATVAGHPDAAAVVLDAAGAANALTAGGAGDRYVDRLTVTGAADGGVVCSTATYLHFRDSDLSANDGFTAGGLAGNGCVVTVVGGSITDNVGWETGAASLNGGWIEVDQTWIGGNDGSVGGIRLLSADLVSVQSAFVGNGSGAEGRDVWLYDGTADVFGSDFGPNTSAGDTAAIALRYSTGAGFTTARYGAGHYRTGLAGLGTTFACATSGTQASCAAVACGGDPRCAEVCDDGFDNDADARVDCADSECAGAESCAEVCGDGLDNDVDTAVDCADSDCNLDPACAIGTCPDLVLPPGLPTQGSGNTAGLPNEVAPALSCAATSGAPEEIWAFTAPADGTYQIDTVGSAYDTVVYVLDSCFVNAPQLACNDDGFGPGGGASQLWVTLVAGQTVYIVVDGWNLTSGAYTLTVQ